MSRISNESDDGMLSKYRTESPSIDEGNGGSSGGGVILKKGPWTSSEDAILVEYVKKHGEGNWNAVQKHSGLSRCGKSCRLRWANHLRPNLKKGAFTQEEEAMILELHSKIGNKWARMATYMPGRTDNEIKNYWNTRVKRRLRAGLPLYPSELQNSHEENQQGQNTGAMGCGDSGKHDSLQANTFEIPNVVFDGLKRNTDVYSYVSECPNMGMALMKSVASPQYHGFAPQTVHRQKRLRECSDVFPDAMGRVQNGFPPQIDQFQDDICRKITGPFGPSFLQDLDPGQTLLSFDATQGVHSLSNGNSSASRPTDGAVKLELPSFQYQDADLSTWENSSTLPFLESTDAYIQSPQKTEAFESGFLAPRNSGLLDDLVHEAKHLSSSKKHSSEKSSHASSFTAGDMADAVLNIWDGAIVSTSTPSNSPMSYINEFSSGGSTLEDAPNAVTFTGCHVKPESGDIDFVPDEEVELKTQMDLPPDALLNANWFDINGHGSVSDAIATVFNDLVAGYNDERSGSSSASQESGFDYFAWKRMPSTISQTSFRH